MIWGEAWGVYVTTVSIADCKRNITVLPETQNRTFCTRCKRACSERKKVVLLYCTHELSWSGGQREVYVTTVSIADCKRNITVLPGTQNRTFCTRCKRACSPTKTVVLLYCTWENIKHLERGKGRQNGVLLRAVLLEQRLVTADLPMVSSPQRGLLTLQSAMGLPVLKMSNCVINCKEALGIPPGTKGQALVLRRRHIRGDKRERNRSGGGPSKVTRSVLRHDHVEEATPRLRILLWGRRNRRLLPPEPLCFSPSKRCVSNPLWEFPPSAGRGINLLDGKSINSESKIEPRKGSVERKIRMILQYSITVHF